MQLLCRALFSWLLLHAAQTAAISPAAAATGTSPPAAVAPTPQLVLFDHDGGVDDFITLLLLLSSPHKVKLIGERITVRPQATGANLRLSALC
jgi:hypothetical protein